MAAELEQGGRGLGDVEVTSDVGVLTVIGDQVVVPAGVSGFTVKAPVKV